MSKSKSRAHKAFAERCARNATPTSEARKALRAMRSYGESRHEDKRDGVDTRGKIYSFETYKTYVKQAGYFARWCEQERGCKTLAECRPLVGEYLAKLEADGLSAYTIKTRAAAIGKVYGESIFADVKTPPRARRDIERSRGDAARDRSFSEAANRDLVTFAKGTGLRRHELAAVRGSQLDRRADGLYIVGVKGKGGKVRELRVRPEAEAVVSRMMREAGDKRVFGRLPSCMDVHGYRRDYVQAWYGQLARDVLELPRAEVYACRDDKAGTWYDRAAMLQVSRRVGHERVSVIASNYLD